LPTSIGIFASRDQAERAFHELLTGNVPRESISLLLPEPDEPRHTGRTVGAFLGAAIGTSTGLSLGLAAATLVVPGIGPVLAIGLGAAALLGFGGVTAGKSVGSGLDTLNEQEHAGESANDLPDAAFFHNILLQNRSVIVVETGDVAAHARASAVLDRLGMGTEPAEDVAAGQLASRNVGDVLVISLSGRFIAGEATARLRELVDQAVELGTQKLLIDMAGVNYLDSSGIGELVHAHIRADKAGGRLRLTRLNAKIFDLMRMTHLDKVMDIENDESQALAAFGR
jgi:anti-sigma B factor antagonist